ncbi:M13 family metallopeptidase [Nocardia abscessus]|uniref:M13 family metallopeptidase n=1 Tax=Nocardia abscessus TaxID=120957 RepID=UPI0024589CB9|nr:M13 family metallopeptidase [Nocardia abscessus]
MVLSNLPRKVSRRTAIRTLGVIAAVGLPSACYPVTPPGAPDPDEFDETVRPQDDLYRHVNGRWLRDYRLPPDQSVCSPMTEAMGRVEQQLSAIIREIREPRPGTPEQQVRDLYAACLNTAAIERLGTTPLADLFAAIDAAESRSELASVMGMLPIPGVIALYVDIDSRDGHRYVATLAQSGLGMDSQYYRKPEFGAHRDAYRAFLERIAVVANFADPAGVSVRAFELERQLAAAQWNAERDQDVATTYNPMAWSELRDLAADFDFDAWLSGRTSQPLERFAHVVVRQPDFITTVGRLWADADIAHWRDYLRSSLLQEFSRFLPFGISDANFEFRRKFLGGASRPAEPWQRAVATVNAELGGSLERLYVAEHFPAAAGDHLRELVDDLLAAYRAALLGSSWLSRSTRAAAVAKLDKITMLIGAPRHRPDYSSVPIDPDKLIDSLRGIRALARRREFDRLAMAVDKSEWTTTAQTVNAFYNRSSNQVVFPAAFLQAPYFDKDADPAVNYGAIGAIIGHEIGHAFDDQGARYDGEGRLRDWWTDEDRAAFDAKTKQLVDQYENLVPEGFDATHRVNGWLTVSENLADLRGLQVAVAAYRRAALRRGTMPDFRTLFLSWARCWRVKQTQQFAAAALAANSHAPSEFRVNQVVRNVSEFYSAFDVTERDRLFLPPEQRVVL